MKLTVRDSVRWPQSFGDPSYSRWCWTFRAEPFFCNLLNYMFRLKLQIILPLRTFLWSMFIFCSFLFHNCWCVWCRHRLQSPIGTWLFWRRRRSLLGTWLLSSSRRALPPSSGMDFSQILTTFVLWNPSSSSTLLPCDCPSSTVLIRMQFYWNLVTSF